MFNPELTAAVEKLSTLVSELPDSKLDQRQRKYSGNHSLLQISLSTTGTLHVPMNKTSLDDVGVII